MDFHTLLQFWEKMASSALLLISFGAFLCPSTAQLFGKDPPAHTVLELPSVMSSVLSNPILEGLSGNAKANEMVKLLKQQTSASQAPFMAVLNQFGVESTPFWVTNKISMKNLNVPAMLALKALPGVFNIREPFQAKLIDPVPSRSNTTATGLSNAEWGVSRIGACEVWDTTTGEGVIVANIDTGVMADHPDLRDNYAGQWHDSIGQEPEPYDDGGHGTHVMGTICGQNGIGVAPGAKWVACKGLGNQGGSDVTLSECAQWILDLEEKPTVVANSWGGGQGQSWFDDEIAAWRAANIVPVFAIGNDGRRGCGSANSPGDRKGVIAVGATTNTDAMASFSSRGPAVRTKIMKPDVSAPGQDIRSAWNNGDYNTISGTSMACPHVAGAVALMRAQNPSISINDILTKLQKTANSKPKPTSSDLRCGTKNNQQYPNNAYGAGIINVAKAMGIA